MAHSYVQHDPSWYVTWLVCIQLKFYVMAWLIRICNMMHFYVIHSYTIKILCVDPFFRSTNFFASAAWLIRIPQCHVTHLCISETLCVSPRTARLGVRHDSFIHANRPVYMCDMMHSYMWLLCICGMAHPSICDMTHSYTFETHCVGAHEKLCLVCAMTFSWVWRDVTQPYACVTWCTHFWHVSSTCDMTRSYVWRDSLICVTWRIYAHVSV